MELLYELKTSPCQIMKCNQDLVKSLIKVYTTSTPVYLNLVFWPPCDYKYWKMIKKIKAMLNIGRSSFFSIFVTILLNISKDTDIKLPS